MKTSKSGYVSVVGTFRPSCSYAHYIGKNWSGVVFDCNVYAVEDYITIEFQKQAHHLMVLGGRYPFKALEPFCSSFLVRDLYLFEENS